MTPRVSVIVTTFNRSAALRRCVDSILGQTFADFELIIVDDASTDDSSDVAHGYADPRVIYHRLAKNAGASLARASLFFVFDSDDTMLAHCLAAFVEAFDARPRLGLAWSWKNLLDRRGDVSAIEKRDRLTTEPRLPLALVYAPGANGLAMRREVFEQLGGFDEAMPRMDDYEFALRFAQLVDWELAVLPLVTMNVHCDTGGNISASPARTLQAREYVLRKHSALFRRYPKEHARHLYQLAQLRLAVSGSRLGFLRALARSLALDPVPRRALSVWRGLPLAPMRKRGSRRVESGHRKGDEE